MMDINTILDDWATRLANDTDIETWCQTNYGFSVSILVGLNLEDPPRKDECPCIVLVPGKKRTGKAVDIESLIAGVALAVYDEAKTTSGKITKYSGIQKVEEFRQLVLTVIAQSLMDGGFIAEVETEYEPVELFPFFWTDMVLEIMRPYQPREDRIT